MSKASLYTCSNDWNGALFCCLNDDCLWNIWTFNLVDWLFDNKEKCSLLV